MKTVQSHPSAALLGVANKPPLAWELKVPGLKIVYGGDAVAGAHP